MTPEVAHKLVHDYVDIVAADNSMAFLAKSVLSHMFEFSIRSARNDAFEEAAVKAAMQIRNGRADVDKMAHAIRALKHKDGQP